MWVPCYACTHDRDLPQRPEMGKDISDLAFFLQPDLAGACMHACLCCIALACVCASWGGST